MPPNWVAYTMHRGTLLNTTMRDPTSPCTTVAGHVLDTELIYLVSDHVNVTINDNLL